MTDKKNHFFGIYEHLRMLMRTIPVNDGVLFRFMVAARLEIDESTGEIFGRRGMSAREWIRKVSGIDRDASFRKASGEATRLGLLEGQRVYKKGERKGGDRVRLNRERWDDLTQLHQNAIENDVQPAQLEARKPSLNGEARKPSLKPDGNRASNLTETEPQHIRNTAIVTATETAMAVAPFLAPDNGGGALTLPQVSSADDPLTSDGREGAELHGQQSGSELPGQPAVNEYPPDGIFIGSFDERLKRDSGKGWYIKAAWADPDTGKVWLVDNEKGRALYQALRDDFSVVQIKGGLRRACSKGREKMARNDLPGWIRTCCGWAAEDEAKKGGKAAGPKFTGFAT